MSKPDSQWVVKKEDWPTKGKSTDKRYTKKMIDDVFKKAEELRRE